MNGALLLLPWDVSSTGARLWVDRTHSPEAACPICNDSHAMAQALLNELDSVRDLLAATRELTAAYVYQEPKPDGEKA